MANLTATEARALNAIAELERLKMVLPMLEAHREAINDAISVIDAGIRIPDRIRTASEVAG